MTKDELIMDVPERIYLMETGEGIAWCEDSSPGANMNPEDSIKYVRADVVEKLAAQNERLRVALDDEAADIRRSGGDISGFAVNVLAEQPIKI